MILTLQNFKKYSLVNLKVELVKSSNLNFKNLVATNPIQNGDTISDHVVKLPTSIRLSGKVSDFFVENLDTGQPKTLQEKLRVLLDLNESRAPFVAQVDYFILENVVIESIDFQSSTNATLPFTITLKQFITVGERNRLVELPSLQNIADLGKLQLQIIQTSKFREGGSEGTPIAEGEVEKHKLFLSLPATVKGSALYGVRTSTDYLNFDIAVIPTTIATSLYDFFDHVITYDSLDYKFQFRKSNNHYRLTVIQDKTTTTIINNKICLDDDPLAVYLREYQRLYTFNNKLYFASIPPQFRGKFVEFKGISIVTVL